MDLSPTHVHLLLNHFPTIGFIIGLALFAAALAARSEHVMAGGLVVLVGIALIAIPTYVTGSAAEDRLCRAATLTAPCDNAAVSRALIEMHEGAALLSLLFIELTGGLAWLALWQMRRFKRIPSWNVALVLLFSLLTLVTVSRAANLGGEIRHPEIRTTQPPPPPSLQFGRRVGNFIRDTPWTWVTSETLHFIGLTLLLGVVFTIDLKILGVLPGITYDTLDRLLPWAILGFGLNVVTGMLFFVAVPIGPTGYTSNVAFYWKIAFVVIAGLNTLIFTFDQSWRHEERPAPIHSKLVAISALFFWVGVMFWGSMLPFIGTAF